MSTREECAIATLEPQGPGFLEAIQRSTTLLADRAVLYDDFTIRIATVTASTYLIGSTSSGALVGDAVILANATSNSITLTLPKSAAATGRIYIVKRIDNTGGKTVTVEVTSGSGDYIDASPTTSETVAYLTSYTYISNGTLWYKI
jgi:hypothetical protein